MHQIVRQYPLALYYPLRTLYLKLKNDEQTEKLKHQFQQQLLLQQQKQANDVEMKDSSGNTQSTTQQKTPTAQASASNTATESLIRVTTLMHRQREMHPTLFNTLEGLIDQLLWLKVNWYEESLRNFKQTLSACYTLAYDYINSTTSVVFKNSQNQSQISAQPIHEYCIDPFSIIWFKRLHKFYAESYLDKFQLARNLFSNGTTGN